MKTDQDYIEQIVKMAENHYGTDEVIFVGVKFVPKTGFVGKLKLQNNQSLIGLSTTSSTKALKRLKDRLNKIISRYNSI